VPSGYERDLRGKAKENTGVGLEGLRLGETGSPI
jgi:hypothetical protein